jgi:hypothetical protein
MSSGWRKSSYSADQGACVEVWRKSRRSSGQGSCVEVAAGGACVAFRDSKDPDGPRLHFAPAAAASLISDIQAGRYNS